MAPFVGDLWPGFPWRTPFWYCQYHTQPVSRDSHRHIEQEHHPLLPPSTHHLWILRSFAEKYGARYFIPYWFMAIWRHQKYLFPVLSSMFIPLEWLFELNHWMKADVKPNDMVSRMLTVDCLNQNFQKLPWTHEYNHICNRVTQHMGIICEIKNGSICQQSLVAVDVIRDKRSQVTELPFVLVLHWVAAPRQSLFWIKIT